MAEAESLKPPPKMSDIMGGPPMHMQPPQQAPQIPQLPAMQQYSQLPVIAQPRPGASVMQQPQPGNSVIQQPQSPMTMNQPQLHIQPQQQVALNDENVHQLPPAPSAPNMFKMQRGRSTCAKI